MLLYLNLFSVRCEVEFKSPIVIFGNKTTTYKQLSQFLIFHRSEVNRIARNEIPYAIYLEPVVNYLLTELIGKNLNSGRLGFPIEFKFTIGIIYFIDNTIKCKLAIVNRNWL